MRVVKNLKELWKFIIERREEIMSTVAKKLYPPNGLKQKIFFAVQRMVKDKLEWFGWHIFMQECCNQIRWRKDDGSFCSSCIFIYAFSYNKQASKYFKLKILIFTAIKLSNFSAYHCLTVPLSCPLPAYILRPVQRFLCSTFIRNFSTLAKSKMKKELNPVLHCESCLPSCIPTQPFVMGLSES